MRATTYRKYLLLLGCLFIGAAAQAKEPALCNKADVQLTDLGADAGAGQSTVYYALKNISHRTCTIRGYTAKSVISGYIDNSMKPIQNKKGKIDTAHITSAPYVLRPNDTAYFNMNSNAPYGDVNAVVKKVVFYFHGIRGPFTITCDCDTNQGLQFGKLSKDKPNF